MSNKKQTSLEWLFDQMIHSDSKHWIDFYNEAKAMHKEEIDQSYSDGYKNGWEDCKTEINKKAIEFINSVKKQDNEQQ